MQEETRTLQKEVIEREHLLRELEEAYEETISCCKKDKETNNKMTETSDSEIKNFKVLIKSQCRELEKIHKNIDQIEKNIREF